MIKTDHIQEQENSVSNAFSAQSSKFDSITTSNPMEVIYRNIVREHVLEYTKVGQSMLELNCGTGLDAVFFAENKLHVHATDNSEGMLEQLKQKVQNFKLEDHISFQKCSFNEISAVNSEKKFDHVFSNFGGLNCADDLSLVIKQLDDKIKKDGIAHFVMIAPICFWEWMAVFKGRFNYAFRRLRKKGARSHVEGHYFITYYYSASYIKKAFGQNYEVVKSRSLGCFMPPTFKETFPAKWPKLFSVLKNIELTVNTLWPFNRVGDLYIISLKKR
ncbi:MAG: class I SAM-dependent methyltransferase [Bacteroidia bacterium]